MASALGAMESLARLYDTRRIPSGDRAALSSKYGIKSVQDLLSQRFQLERSGRKHLSTDGYRRLTPAVEYLSQRVKRESTVNDDESLVEHLTASASLSKSWERFLARKVLQVYAKLRRERTMLQRKKRRMDQSELLPFSQYGFITAVSDVESVEGQDAADTKTDEESLKKEFGINSEDSPWELDIGCYEVFLKEFADGIRIPVPLFKDDTFLLRHQIRGVEWMAGLYAKDTGGILGE